MENKFSEFFNSNRTSGNLYYMWFSKWLIFKPFLKWSSLKIFFTQIYNDAYCIYKLELLTLEYFLHEANMSPLEDLGDKSGW